MIALCASISPVPHLALCCTLVVFIKIAVQYNTLYTVPVVLHHSGYNTHSIQAEKCRGERVTKV